MRLTGTGLKEAGDNLSQFSDDELWRLFDQIDTVSAGGDMRLEVKEWLVHHKLSKRDPAAALEAALRSRMREEVFSHVMKNWANKDLKNAYAWFSENRDQLVPQLDGVPPHAALLRGLVEGIAESDLDAGLTFVCDQWQSEDAVTLISGLSRSLLGRKDHETHLDLAIQSRSIQVLGVRMTLTSICTASFAMPLDVGPNGISMPRGDGSMITATCFGIRT